MTKKTAKADRLAIVQTFRKSGMSVAHFGGLHGIARRTLSTWLAEFPKAENSPFLVLQTIEKTITALTDIKQSLLAEGQDLIRTRGSRANVSSYEAFFNAGVDPAVDRKMKEWAAKNKTTPAKAYEFAAAKLLKLI